MAGNRKHRRMMQRSGQTSRTFAYDNGVPEGMPGRVSLSFSLRTDIKDHLRDFLELLEAAIVDVQEEVARPL